MILTRENQKTANQEIPCLLWYFKVLYHVHNSLQLVHILSQIDPVHTLPTYSLRPMSILSLIFQLVSSFQAFQPNFSTHFSCPHACYIPCPAHPPSFDLIILKLWCSSMCNFLQYPVTSASYIQIFFSTPCSQTASIMHFSSSMPIQNNG
jgi:hypothetical protein